MSRDRSLEGKTKNLKATLERLYLTSFELFTEDIVVIVGVYWKKVKKTKDFWIVSMDY